jgi:GNAT superfamily N-acetyltransferase
MKIKMVDASLRAVAAKIREMDLLCFPELVHLGPIELHGDWWIAYDPTPVAYAGLWPSIRTPGAGYLCRAGVLPQARGKGLQRKLIKAREREALKKEWVALFSDTDPVNSRSMNNLIACGFESFRPPQPWASHGEDWCYWRKIIRPGVA